MNDTMSREDMLAVRAGDYLRDGFLTKSNELREGINGLYSTAMAYRCLEEGIAPDDVDKLVGRLSKIGDDFFRRVGDAPDSSLDEEARNAVRIAEESGEVARSESLHELLAVSRPLLKRFRDLAALVVHLERIGSELALISSLKTQER